MKHAKEAQPEEERLTATAASGQLGSKRPFAVMRHPTPTPPTPERDPRRIYPRPPCTTTPPHDIIPLTRFLPPTYP